MRKKACVLLMILATGFAQACTNMLVSPSDGSKLVGRSMEFGQDLRSQVIVIPRGQKIQSTAPNNQKGLSWTNKYGYIALNCFDMNFPVDGMNEKGLSYGALWMPGSEYQKVGPNDLKTSLSTSYVGPWILANFSTVAEVKAALGKVKIWGEPLAALNNEIPPIHIIIQDTKGGSAVIEFFKGQVKFHNNPLGVLTNYPWFDWQIINLQNFINLKALNASPQTLNGITLGGTGQGTGLLGIPGDWTPPSRFVRIALFQEFAIKPTNALEGVNLLTHLLNTVDIPTGDVLEKGGNKPIFDYTQWVVIKDLTNRQFYYRTYQDQTLHKIDFNQLNIKPGAPALKLELSLNPTFVDETKNFKTQ